MIHHLLILFGTNHANIIKEYGGNLYLFFVYFSISSIKEKVLKRIFLLFSFRYLYWSENSYLTQNRIKIYIHFTTSNFICEIILIIFVVVIWSNTSALKMNGAKQSVKAVRCKSTLVEGCSFLKRRWTKWKRECRLE